MLHQNEEGVYRLDIIPFYPFLEIIWLNYLSSAPEVGKLFGYGSYLKTGEKGNSQNIVVSC